jgi:hypothetical protein
MISGYREASRGDVKANICTLTTAEIIIDARYIAGFVAFIRGPGADLSDFAAPLHAIDDVAVVTKPVHHLFRTPAPGVLEPIYLRTWKNNSFRLKERNCEHQAEHGNALTRRCIPSQQ